MFVHLAKKILVIASVIYFAGAITASAQVRNGSNTQPHEAISVRCVDITGTVFESCAGSGGGGGSDLTASASLTTNVCPGAGCVTLALTQPISTATISVQGTFVARVSFKASADAGVTYYDLWCNNTDSTGTLDRRTVDTPAIFQCNVAGYTHVRVWNTIYTSGTVDVVIRATVGASEPFNTSTLLKQINTTLTAVNGQSASVDITSINGTVVTGTPGQLDINCISGCASPPSTPDGSGFSAGVTSVGPINSFVVDDTATTSVAEDTYGAARMNPNRIQYTDLSKSAANTAPFLFTPKDSSGNDYTFLNPFPVAGSVDQGTPGTFATSSWWTKISDGTNGPVAVKAASTSAIATDPALVIRSVQLPTALAANGGLKIEGVASGVAVPVSFTNTSHTIIDTGSTTAVTQATASNLNAQVVGAVASNGINAGNPVKVGGVFNTTQPTITSGNIVDAQYTTRGAQIVSPGTEGFAVTFTGAQPVNLLSIASNAVVSGGANGTLAIGGTAANNAAITQNPVLTAAETIAAGSQPTAATGGNQRRILASTEGVQYVQEGNSNRFSCFVQAVTATTQCQAAPAAGLRAYVTSAHMSNQAATVQSLDIVFGTGTNCGTGTTALTHKWQMGTNATTTSPQSIESSFNTPLVPTAANAICVRPSAATAFGVTLTGYIAP